jgi:YVTN family beta-propeller protein
MRRLLIRGRWWRVALVTLSACLAAPAAASAARVVYVSNGLGGSQNVSALAMAADGSLSPIPGSPFPTGGTTQEGLSITPNAQHLYVSLFGTGNVTGFNVGPGGGLATVPGAPYATGSTPLGNTPTPDGSHLFVWNHGNAVGVWTIAADGSLTQIAGSPFPVSAGHTNPFAGSVSPSGNFLYVPDENPNPSTVTVYSVASTGSLSIAQTIPTGHNPFGSAITPDGKFFYVSAPEADPGYPNGSIIMYAVSPATGLLTEIGTRVNPAPGNHPLEMAITPDGRFLYVATRITSTVNAYAINSVTGTLTPVAGQPFATGGTNGKSLAVTPDGKRLYVANQGSNNVSGLDIAVDGSLSSIPGSPWPTGGTSPDLESIAITPNQAPTASFTVAPAPTGNPTKVDGSGSSDTDDTVASYHWDFGDGTIETTTTPTNQHSYANPGSYTATLTVTDNEGCSTLRIFTGEATLCNGAPTATTTRPVAVTAAAKLSNLKVSPSTLVAANHGASIAATGAKVTYKDTLAWTTTFVVQQAKRGIKQGGMCVKPPKHPPPAAKKCTRFVNVGSFTHTDKAGDNSFRFTGRVKGHKLADGSYRFEATPRLGAFVGNTVHAGFRVVTLKPTPSRGGGGGGGGGAPRATARITRLRINPRAFAPDRRGASITRARRRKTGSRVNYNDSQAATTTFTVLRAVPGVKGGRRCVRAPRKGKVRKGRRCTRLVRVGAFTHRDRKGSNSFHFTGRVRGGKLAVGRYLLRARPRFAGRNGNTATTSFRITK